VVTAQARSGQGAAEVILLPELLDINGKYAGFGAPIVLATVGTAGNIAVGDFTGAGTTDLAVADKGGVTIIYGKPLTLTPNTTAATVAQTASALLISALLTGFPDTGSGAANFGGESNGNVNPSNGSTQTSSGGLAASTGADGGGGDQVTDGHSSLLVNVIDRVFSDLPDSVSGFVDLADALMQDGADAAQTLADRINAFLKSQKPPAPMTTPPESLRPMPEAEWRQGDKETRRQGDSPSSGNEEVANASPTEYTEWHANEYGLTLFLASGLGYIGLRDLADRDSAARKKRRDIPLR
jgi:hypothetical protein